jgi:DNA-binding MarR family transcriptional regulator
MGKETEKILELINYWKEFTEDHTADLSDFGRWLQKKELPTPELSSNRPDTSFRDRYIHEQVPVADQIVLHWGRLLRFTQLWSKKAVSGLPINSVEEYGLLKSVALLGSVRKSVLVKSTLLETTTCFEMIKRLAKAGYLAEDVDPDDKRSRKVSLTGEGKVLTDRCDIEMKKLSTLLLGNISEAQKSSLLEVLRSLDTFHAGLYDSQANTLDEMLKKKDAT